MNPYDATPQLSSLATWRPVQPDMLRGGMTVAAYCTSGVRSSVKVLNMNEIRHPWLDKSVNSLGPKCKRRADAGGAAAKHLI